MSEPSNNLMVELMREAEWERAKGSLRAMMRLSYSGWDKESYEDWKAKGIRLEKIIKHIEERYF